MCRETRYKGITFGFADNDLLIHSDGRSCCSGSDLYLNCQVFDSNIVGLAKGKTHGDLIRFAELSERWRPHNLISPYLNSKSRIDGRAADQPEWEKYSQAYWNGAKGLYRPDFFDGVEDTSAFDDEGNKVYVRAKSKFESQMEI